MHGLGNFKSWTIYLAHNNSRHVRKMPENYSIKKEKDSLLPNVDDVFTAVLAAHMIQSN